mmetsp:Transcript_31913/g.28270  ORF Transcript_31913/g.28270 Transcript_31913/m.28270 type:complete len:185 (+) Transcript_31913:180-734(+)
MRERVILCMIIGLLFIEIFNFNHVVYIFNPEKEGDLIQARFDLLFLSSEEELRMATFSIVFMYPHFYVPIEHSMEVLREEEGITDKNIAIYKEKLAEHLDPDGIFYSNKNMHIYLMHYYNKDRGSSEDGNGIRIENIQSIFKSIRNPRAGKNFSEYLKTHHDKMYTEELGSLSEQKSQKSDIEN